MCVRGAGGPKRGSEGYHGQRWDCGGLGVLHEGFAPSHTPFGPCLVAQTIPRSSPNGDSMAPS